jgi:peptide/nickel transport system substrate-binding protein
MLMVCAMMAGCGKASGNNDKNTSKNDTLKVALAVEPPSITTCEHDSLVSVYMNLLNYNGLMRIDFKTLTAVPDLAESYETVSDTEWVFKLHKGVKFHDGEEMKAADVVASLEWAKTFTGSAGYTKHIAKVEAQDDYTVKITTDQPYAGLLYDLAYHFNFIVPKSLIDNGHNFGESPVGTGPYKFVSWDSGNSLTFEAFDDYFDTDRKASIKNLIFSIIPEGNSRTIALEAGEVDFVYDASTTDVSRLKSTDGIEVSEIQSVENYFLLLNTDVAPFDNVYLRQAINYAVNRDDIISAALDGFGTANYTAISPQYPDSTTDGAASFDMEKAKECLKKWGGDPSSVVIPVICSNKTKESIATVMQSTLKELGITIQIVSEDTATYFADWQAGKYTALISSWSPSNALTYVQRYHSDRAKSYPGSIKNDDLDKMIKSAETIIDDTERSKAIHDIIVKCNELVPQISLYLPSYYRAYNSGLAGVNCSATGYVSFNEIYWK